MDTTNVNQDDLFMARMTLDEVQEEGGILSSQKTDEGGIVMQNTDMSINDTLIAELSQEATVVLDTEEIVDTTPEEANGETAEANAQQTDGEEEQPDEHGLVYVTRTFTVNPQEYESDNYRPINQGATAEADQKPNETIEEAKAVEITETADGKATADEKIVLDYATYIDGSSFLCFDEQSDIDYSKIAMDGGNKKPPTRANCDTTFNQCRAKNPLFCRYHGPKLLEVDIKAAIRRQLRDYKLSNDGNGPFTIEVTKAKKASPNTFTVTVGCTPKQKKHVEMILDRFLHDHKGISTTDKLKEGDKDSYMQEFEMDILKADKPPKRGNIIEESAAEERDKAVEKGKVMPVVRETEEEVEEETAEGEGATEEVAETKEAETDTVSSPEEQQAAGENKDNLGEKETERAESEKDTAKESGEGKDIGEEVKEQESEETTPILTPIERAEKTADIAISSGVASQEEQEVAESIKEAAKKAKQSKKVGEELKAHLEEKRGNGGAGEALAVASVVGAMEKAKSETAEQEKKIQEEEKRLKQLQEQSNREAENKVKGIAAAKVESALQQMAKQIFTTADSKSGSIDKEAEKVVSDLGEYAKSKGYEGETGDEIGELVEEIKERNGRLQSMMEAFSKAVEQKGDAFHEEDVSHLAEVISRSAGRLGDRFRVLQGLALYEKKRIDDAEKVAAEKKALEEKINGVNREDERESEGSVRAEKSTEGTAESQARIEEIYKDWVEEEVPEWVNKLSAEEQMEYIGKLEKAMTTDIEEDGSAFDALLEYEERMEQEVANRKESKVEEVKPKKEEPESGTDTKKSEADARKEQIAAARRLGMDAYKSADELKKILNMAKRHLSDPRQAQRAKDIEVILADREAKKDLPKRFVEDKSAEEARSDESVKQMMIEGLEG